MLMILQNKEDEHCLGCIRQCSFFVNFRVWETPKNAAEHPSQYWMRECPLLTLGKMYQ